eukprot:GEMP01001731.1.p1 GENE.GEMP01001731.1~~GEMP01001731.1.p1  ORF type:complete len:1225 (+),score=322.79 GEMP01001731.1:516-4190(+)
METKGSHESRRRSKSGSRERPQNMDTGERPYRRGSDPSSGHKRKRERAPGERRERAPGERRERTPGERRERSPGDRMSQSYNRYGERRRTPPPVSIRREEHRMHPGPPVPTDLKAMNNAQPPSWDLARISENPYRFSGRGSFPGFPNPQRPPWPNAPRPTNTALEMPVANEQQLQTRIRELSLENARLDDNNLHLRRKIFEESQGGPSAGDGQQGAANWIGTFAMNAPQDEGNDQSPGLRKKSVTFSSPTNRSPRQDAPSAPLPRTPSSALKNVASRLSTSSNNSTTGGSVLMNNADNSTTLSDQDGDKKTVFEREWMEARSAAKNANKRERQATQLAVRTESELKQVKESHEHMESQYIKVSKKALRLENDVLVLTEERDSILARRDCAEADAKAAQHELRETTNALRSELQEQGLIDRTVAVENKRLSVLVEGKEQELATAKKELLARERDLQAVNHELHRRAEYTGVCEGDVKRLSARIIEKDHEVATLISDLSQMRDTRDVELRQSRESVSLDHQRHSIQLEAQVEKLKHDLEERSSQLETFNAEKGTSEQAYLKKERELWESTFEAKVEKKEFQRELRESIAQTNELRASLESRPSDLPHLQSAWVEMDALLRFAQLCNQARADDTVIPEIPAPFMRASVGEWPSSAEYRYQQREGTAPLLQDPDSPLQQSTTRPLLVDGEEGVERKSDSSSMLASVGQRLSGGGESIQRLSGGGESIGSRMSTGSGVAMDELEIRAKLSSGVVRLFKEIARLSKQTTRKSEVKAVPTEVKAAQTEVKAAQSEMKAAQSKMKTLQTKIDNLQLQLNWFFQLARFVGGVEWDVIEGYASSRMDSLDKTFQHHRKHNLPHVPEIEWLIFLLNKLGIEEGLKSKAVVNDAKIVQMQQKFEAKRQHVDQLYATRGQLDKIRAQLLEHNNQATQNLNVLNQVAQTTSAEIQQAKHAVSQLVGTRQVVLQNMEQGTVEVNHLQRIYAEKVQEVRQKSDAIQTLEEKASELRLKANDREVQFFQLQTAERAQQINQPGGHVAPHATVPGMVSQPGAPQQVAGVVTKFFPPSAQQVPGVVSQIPPSSKPAPPLAPKPPQKNMPQHGPPGMAARVPMAAPANSSSSITGNRLSFIAAGGDPSLESKDASAIKHVQHLESSLKKKDVDLQSMQRMVISLQEDMRDLKAKRRQEGQSDDLQTYRYVTDIDRKKASAPKNRIRPEVPRPPPRFGAIQLPDA